MNLAIVFLNFCFFSESVLGAESSGDGHISTLMWPAINLTTLLVFLIWKLKGSMVDYFGKYEKEVRERYDLAQKKDKEAQVKLEVSQKKMADFASKEKEIQEEIQRDAGLFQQNIDKETQLIVAKIKQEGTERIDHERESFTRRFNETLMDTIVKHIRQEVADNEKSRQKITNRLALLVK